VPNGRGQPRHDDFRVTMRGQADGVGEAPGRVRVSDIANCQPWTWIIVRSSSSGSMRRRVARWIGRAHRLDQRAA
jgi:hypothetical protein